MKKRIVVVMCACLSLVGIHDSELLAQGEAPQANPPAGAKPAEPSAVKPASPEIATPPVRPADGQNGANAAGEIEEQAANHHKAGREAIQQRDWQKAIKELESSVRLTPANAARHHALGVAYMGAEQPNSGWFHFRQAVRLNPGYQPAVVDFMRTWQLIDAQGVFGVGTPVPAVVQTLGKPDQADDQGVRLRLVYGFMSLNFMNGQLFSILDLRNLPPEGLHAVDGLAFELPRTEWKVAFRILSSSQGNTEYVRNDESLKNWSELFSSQRFINVAETQSAVDMMKSLQARVQAASSEARFEVVQESPGDVIFIWSVPEGAEGPAQQEVVRLVRGERDIHRLAYTQRGEMLNAEEMAPWEKLIQEAKLMSAEDLRLHLAKEEKRLQEAQLREISIQILKRQFELIRTGEIDELKVFFAEDVRGKITPELLAKVTAKLETLKPEEMIHEVELEEVEGVLEARLLDQSGAVFTTLSQTGGRWFAETVWLEKVAE